jgi:hypothetical protein
LTTTRDRARACGISLDSVPGTGLAEFFTDPPRGERRSVDLVARLPLRPGVPHPATASDEPADFWLTLIHVEIESRDSVAPLRPRMFSYYEQLRCRHGLPVLPIALYLRVGLDGIGWDVHEEWYWDHRLVAFEYAYVGLPALDGEQYVAGEHLLGVALTALMRVPRARRVEVHAEALRRLAEARENEYRRYLLLDCLEAYATLDEAQAQELEALLRTERYQEAQAMPMTSFEKGLEQGQRRMLQKLLEARFGSLSTEVRQRLDSLSPEQLEALALELLEAGSLQELGLED